MGISEPIFVASIDELNDESMSMFVSLLAHFMSFFVILNFIKRTINNDA